MVEGGYSAPGAASTVLESDFVADASGKSTRTGRSVGERAELEFRLARRYRRLFLRRLFDQAEIQKAELTVNGQRLGVWAHNDPNETHRFAESDVWIPAALVGVDGRLQIELRVLSGSWVTFGYELYGEESSP